MSKLSKMRIGGEIHGNTRKAIYDYVDIGITPSQVEAKTVELILAADAEIGFAKVKGYNWATCINVNSSTVHGIPTSNTPFADGDVVTVDLGVYYHGYHLDGAFTKVVGTASKEAQLIIDGGLATLQAALEQVKPGNRIGHISRATEQTLKSYGLSPFQELTGHGVGRELHEDPMIPNYLDVVIETTPQIVIGQTLAIEMIYTAGKPELVLEENGWTISTKDDKLSGVFEETVEVTHDGYSILTKPTLSQITKSGKI